MYNIPTLSINELELSRLSLNSDDRTRGGGSQESFELKKLDESSQSENIHKSPPNDNPRLANALNWCKRRKLERDNLRVAVKGRK
jgi:hypothetical protein